MRSICFVGAIALTASAAAQETVRVSVDSSGAEAGGTTYECSISGDGRYVAFTSDASNLVAGDANGSWDVFVRDRTTGVTECVSVDSSGAIGDGPSYEPWLSADGQVVVFVSQATNLVSGDANGVSDVFVRDRGTGVTERVSKSSLGVEANGLSYLPSISGDGAVVAFTSYANDLVGGDGNGRADVFVRLLSTGVTERVSSSSAGAEGNGNSGYYAPAGLSRDGAIVAFFSGASNLVAHDTNGWSDVFVRDRSTGTTERVSVDSTGAQGNDASYSASLSADGRLVAFDSSASNLVAGDTNRATDVFVRDRSGGTTERVSVDASGTQASGVSHTPLLCADGTVVAFTSDAADLVAGDTNGCSDAFVRNLASGTTIRRSVDSAGVQGDAASRAPSLSSDGQDVAFVSDATNLVANDANGFADAFMHEGCSTLASWSNYGAGFPGTRGIPAFTARSNPGLGTTVTLDLENSYGSFTVGLLFVGLQRASIHSSFGGDLLVAPVVTLLVGIDAGGLAPTGDIAHDDSLCGTVVDLQALENDPGAAKGVSFTAGLELVFGH